MKLLDPWGRSINYLRISVTDRCNLRCVYCMPSEGIPLIPHKEILSYEEIVAVAEAAAGLGVSKIRVTGGEPLVRAELPKLIAMLSQIEGIDEVSLTTNGILLKENCARELKQAGLRRVNISLDTLKAERFRYITRYGELRDTLDAIETARRVGFEPIKINMVVVRGVNYDEVLDFAKLTFESGWHIRFIELMPFSGVTEFVPSTEIRQRVGSLGTLEPGPGPQSNGPARYYRFPGAKGTLGFISCISEPFCSRCNRLRLTSDGKLKPCLLDDGEIDLKGPLRNNASLEEIKHLILQAVASKPEHHRLSERLAPIRRKMSQTGG